MAISPADFTFNKNAVEAWEKYLDEKLRESEPQMKLTGDYSKRYIVYPESKLPRLGSRERQELRRRYVDAGWASLTFHENQFDGTWLELCALT